MKRTIEIAALSNGAHRNNFGDNVGIPEGWAEIPEGMEIPSTWPFVGVAAVDGIVTELTAGTVPDPEPEPTPEPTVEEHVAALEDAACEADTANDARMTDIEKALCELDGGTTNG